MCDVPVKRNVPVLRFPGFTEEWEKCSLSDIGLGFDYGMNAAAKAYDGENKYIRITDIDESSSLYNAKDIVSPDGDLSENYLVNDNDILLARTGASTGKSYLYTRSDGKLYFAGFLIRCNIPTHNPYFIFSQLHTRRFWKWVSIMSARSGQPGINSQEYASFPLYVCSKAEENKVASLLKLIDKRIELQNKIIEKLETLIKGIVECTICDSKPNTRICDCFECYSSTLQENQLSNIGLYPVYGATGVSGYIDKPNVCGASVLIIKDGSGIGTVKYVNGKYSYIGTLNRLTAKDGYCLKYLYYALLEFNFEPYKTGMAIPHIYFKDYGKAKIFVPTFEQQSVIAQHLSCLEDKITLERQMLHSLQKQKVFLLTHLFI